MRVLMIGPRFDCRGGISAAARALHGYLRDEGVVATYLASTVEGGALRRIGYSLGSYAAFLVRAVGGRYDLVHVHVSVQNSFFRKSFYLIVSALLGRRFVIQIHPERFAAFFSASPERTRGMIRWIFRKASAVIVLTPSIRAKMKELFPGTDFLVLANPIDCSEYGGGPRPEGDQVLFMGLISPEKGARDLIETVPAVASRVPSVRFALFGPVNEGFPLGAKLEAGKLANIRWKAWVSGEEKVRAFRESRMLVLPSYSEGLPNVLLEAMASSLPVVATPVGGVPDLVVDGVNGFLVRPGDKEALGNRILRLLADPDLGSRMGAAGRRLVEKEYDLPVVGRRLLGIYARLAEDPTAAQGSSEGSEG